MKPISLKTLMRKSLKYRNEQAIKHLISLEEQEYSYYGKPLPLTKEEKEKKKTKNPFKIGSLFLQILP